MAMCLTPAVAQAQTRPRGLDGRVEEAAERARASAALPAAGFGLNAATELGEIEVDGVLDEDDWNAAVLFTNFTQRTPVEGASVVHDTEVRVLFGDEAIWIGARMWDSEPGTIDRRLTRRDAAGTFDQFTVLFDPNLDGLTGYSFGVSAANVQSDAYYSGDTRKDGAWNAVWTSAVTVDEDGWSAEMRIPLSQIRYEASDDPQTWGINLHRLRSANNERSYYSLISGLRRGIVSQSGRLDNVLVRRPSRRLEILPYAVSRLERGPAEAGDPFFDGNVSAGEIGVDVSYGLGAAFTLDATINPDFGQVEADPAVINLSAFETFFPEQRPFFVEDARVFDFGLTGSRVFGRSSLFHSRRVGRAPHGRAPSDAEFSDVPGNVTILGAAKLSGRTSKGLSVGLLAAATGTEYGEGLFPDGVRNDFLVEPGSQFAVLSLSQDFNEGRTQIGTVSAAMRRDLPDDGLFDWLPSSAFNAGVRFEHQWSDREWAVSGFFAGSHVRGATDAMTRIQTSSTHYLQRPDATRFSVDPDAKSLSGRDWRLQVEKRGGRHWTGGLWVAEVSDLFEINDLGFSTTSERLDGGFRVGYREIIPGTVLRNYTASLTSTHNWSHEALDDVWSFGSWTNARTAGSFSLSANGQFLNYWNFRTSLRHNLQKMSRSATRGGPIMVGPAATNWSINLSSDRRKTLSLGATVAATDDHVGSGGRTSIRGDVRVRPADNLALTLSPRWESSTTSAQYVTSTTTLAYDPTYGTRYLFADLDRTTVSMEMRVDWTFSPTLSLQLFAQPLLSSGENQRYKQLAASRTFDFNEFVPGVADVQPDQVLCSSTICEVDGVQHVDFDGDGITDHSFSDRDFNIRSLIGNAVLRWEYRPGSTVFFVWQRSQAGRSSEGDFDFGRDLGALFNAPATDRFILKVTYWLGL